MVARLQLGLAIVYTPKSIYSLVGCHWILVRGDVLPSQLALRENVVIEHTVILCVLAMKVPYFNVFRLLAT